MNVVYYSSDFFSEMCGVAMESLCANNTDTESITIYIVEDHISEKNKQRLKSITDKYNRNLVFICMPSQEDVYPGVKANLGRTYARMALGEILPENVERVLSLDSDTLVVDSLKDMYNVQFGKNEYVAGVYDCVGAAIQKRVLHVNDDLKYCNAGMLLIDLKEWRKRKVGNKLLDAVLKNADGKHIMYFLEQDLMNLIFYRHIKLLPARYNVLTSVYKFDYNEIIKMKRPVTYYSEEEIREAKEKPALFHATTCFYIKKRMWVENSDHPCYDVYLQYRNNTPWKDERQVEDSRKLSKKISAELWHCVPKTLAVNIATFTINHVRPFYAWITTKAEIATIAEQSAT